MVESEARYFIDLKWYEENERSFSVLAQSRLCPSCREKLSTEHRADSELLTTFKDCCSKQEGFFSPKLPLQEMIFRIFLSNGNQPLAIEELSRRLREWLIGTGDTRDVSANKLKRIISHDRYYGFRPVPQGESA